MRVQGPTSPNRFAQAEFEIRVRYREGATIRWLVGVVAGILLVAGLLLLGVTGPLALAIAAVYALFMLTMAVRSAFLLSRLRR